MNTDILNKSFLDVVKELKEYIAEDDNGRRKNWVNNNFSFNFSPFTLKRLISTNNYRSIMNLYEDDTSELIFDFSVIDHIEHTLLNADFFVRNLLKNSSGNEFQTNGEIVFRHNILDGQIFVVCKDNPTVIRGLKLSNDVQGTQVKLLFKDSLNIGLVEEHFAPIKYSKPDRKQRKINKTFFKDTKKQIELSSKMVDNFTEYLINQLTENDLYFFTNEAQIEAFRDKDFAAKYPGVLNIIAHIDNQTSLSLKNASHMFNNIINDITREISKKYPDAHIKTYKNQIFKDFQENFIEASSFHETDSLILTKGELKYVY